MRYYRAPLGSKMPHNYNNIIPVVIYDIYVNMFGSYCQIEVQYTSSTFYNGICTRVHGAIKVMFTKKQTLIYVRASPWHPSHLVYIPNKEEEQRQLLTFACKNRKY